MNKNVTQNLILFLFILIVGCNDSRKSNHNLLFLIENGEFNHARHLIDEKLADVNLTEERYAELLWKKDLMRRIEREFSMEEQEVVQKLLPYFGDEAPKLMPAWEKEKSLECRLINGQKRYFKNAVPNLFRINADAKKRKEELKGVYVDPLAKYCLQHTADLVQKTKGDGEAIHPVKNVFDYTITVDADAVPAGEIIRCWMPYPHENSERQKDVELISINSDTYKIAPDSYPQRSIYCEKVAEAGKETIFNLKFRTTSYAQVFYPEKMNVKAYDTSSDIYKEYTKEKAPQIIFTDRIKLLADEICGEETHPLKQVELIYNWIDTKIPWASALEYSVMPNIPEYVLDNNHGDCGMQTLLFMTLARYRGIPVKWQSGWMLHPGEVNLHDWCEVYYEGIGWVPLDQSFELQKSNVAHVRDFYRTGIDAHRLIVNDDFSREFYPKKVWPRSEPIDFQRGELEWKGGNLYFSDWSYKMKVSYE